MTMFSPASGCTRPGTVINIPSVPANLTPPVSQVPRVDLLDTQLLSAPSEGHIDTRNYVRKTGHMITTCCGGFWVTKTMELGRLQY